MEFNLSLNEREYRFVHAAQNACRQKYGIVRTEPVTICVLAVDLAMRLSVHEFERKISRSAMKLAGPAPPGFSQYCDGEETKTNHMYASLSVPSHIVAEMARLWYSSMETPTTMTLAHIVLSFFDLLTVSLTEERLQECRASRAVRENRRWRRQRRSFADQGVYDEAWSGESVMYGSDW